MATSTQQRTPRIAPTPLIGLLVVLGYLAVLTTLTVLTPDPEPLTVAWVVAELAVPIGLAAAGVVVAVTVLRWWQPVMSEQGRPPLPRWLWVVPVVGLVAGVFNFFDADPSSVPTDVLLTLALGVVCVAVGEELTFRGVLLVGLRARFGEWVVWFVTSLVFGSAHLTNLLFGAGVVETLQQVVFAFTVGSSYYVTRRLSGSLVLPMVLHWTWDYAGFVGGSA